VTFSRTALVALLALALAAPAHAAERTVPRNFIGTVADGVLTDQDSRFLGQLDPMVAAGAESIRMVFDWRVGQPYKRMEDVPAEQRQFFRAGADESGVPTDYRAFDRYVEEAARRGMTIRPVVMLAPPWAARHPGSEPSPPKSFRAYANFTAALARRYGDGGTFWTERPDVPRIPIESWQVWNEPHFKEFWSDQPWQKDYVKLLKLTYATVKKAAPKAKIVAAGLANKSWTYLSMIYAQGAKGFFDIAAIHPFTATVDGVVEILERARAVMKRYHDRKRPLLVSELSWTSARGRTDFTYGNEQTERGQAKRLTAAFKRMAKERTRLRLLGIYWYTWMTRDKDPVYPFDYAGVVRLKGNKVEQKPAYKAYKSTALSLEGCKSKQVGKAQSCVH
jgi:hypothetical protein